MFKIEKLQHCNIMEKLYFSLNGSSLLDLGKGRHTNENSGSGMIESHQRFYRFITRRKRLTPSGSESS